MCVRAAINLLYITPLSAEAKEEKSRAHNLPGVPACVVISDWKGGLRGAR